MLEAAENALTFTAYAPEGRTLKLSFNKHYNTALSHLSSPGASSVHSVRRETTTYAAGTARPQQSSHRRDNPSRKGNVQNMHITSSDEIVAPYRRDTISSLSYRVKSMGTRFRSWAIQTLGTSTSVFEKRTDNHLIVDNAENMPGGFHHS